MNFAPLEALLEYHERHKPQALLITQDSQTRLERYEDGFRPETAHALYSGTKSFWGVAAVTAQSEGLLALDEPVAQTIPSWNADAWKRRVTIRQLLQLTAGFPFGGLGSAVPAYGKALAMDLRDEPGSRFTYGGIPLQVFGAVLTEKLRRLQMTPHQYLQSSILDPMGVQVAKWRELSDGTHPLPTGAFLTARNWQRFGGYIAANAARYGECFIGSSANPRYGLAWSLAPGGAPQDLFYASGSGGQALYVLPSKNLVIARFGQGGSFKHEAFLRRLPPR